MLTKMSHVSVKLVDILFTWHFSRSAINGFFSVGTFTADDNHGQGLPADKKQPAQDEKDVDAGRTGHRATVEEAAPAHPKGAPGAEGWPTNKRHRKRNGTLFSAALTHDLRQC